MKAKKMRRISSNSESGAILLIVIILMLAVTITGLAFLNAGVMENSLVRREIHKNQAFYLAEAGVEATIWQLNYGDSSLSGWTQDAEGNYHSPMENLEDPQGSSVGDYKVTVQDKETNNPVIESTGYVPSIEAEGRVEKTVRVTLEKTHHPIFDYAVASGDEIKVEDPDTLITGDLYAAGDITIEDGATINGEIFERADDLSFPEFDSDYYLASPGLVVISEDDLEDGEWRIKEDDYINGIWYVKGNVTISNSTLVGPGSIVAEGTILVEEGSQVGTSIDTAVSLISAHYGEEDPAIKIEGNETNSSEVWGVLWAPNGKIKIEWSTIHGSVVSGDNHKIETGSGVTYIYEEFSDGSLFLPSVYSVQRWEEQ